MDLESFTTNVELIESAFEQFSAAFYLDSVAGGHAIDVFDFFDGIDSADEWVDIRAFALDIQQLFFFAFERAPVAVVRSWGDDHFDGGGDSAVERVDIIRAKMPYAFSEWVNRFTDIAPTLGDVTTNHIFDHYRDQTRTLVNIESFVAGGLRKMPIDGSRKSLSANLSRNELRRLIDSLRMADAMYDDDFTSGRSDVDGGVQ